ncbi:MULTISPECIES: 30S ribosomal protein S6 [Sinorhizobium/Ensifer group]|uniref:Small ribosomal subunit protein bS6 n=1 Tax=Sinorhizobium alkalisoli TaxID=1752398 RepID=A0A1E3V6P4_9HYPH|nr:MULTISPECIES: 30S ribosomal protein S6 [Sinorhizobium/Ensifer group]MCA1493693.1 30S ribosomal protein S6 [Ensifer sp. NBAIM29]MCG5478035.1 30S ribosomal protein S6 [Sinorhizobium alkalisoli]ODR89199.1 30S ribosomal protein S6 [Sinorhizobium alkalisoli]OHV72257.1 30S ribosomal protein S6 [Ensifer sp. LCM 4579]QFI65646.1 SSU ribosomal protein S6p [Sinorhizobium alkalisoli]
MALYEHVFLARQDITPQQVDALVEQYKGVIEANGGKVGRVENWGLKSLTYRIKKNRKAHYVLMDIDAPAPAVHEVERQMRINEDVLRYMTIAVEKHEEGPSAMMQKRDRDDRPRGEGRGPRDGGDRGPRSDRGDREDRPRRPREDRA